MNHFPNYSKNYENASTHPPGDNARGQQIYSNQLVDERHDHRRHIYDRVGYQHLNHPTSQIPFHQSPRPTAAFASLNQYHQGSPNPFISQQAVMDSSKEAYDTNMENQQQQQRVSFTNYSDPCALLEWRNENLQKFLSDEQAAHKKEIEELRNTHAKALSDKEEEHRLEMEKVKSAHQDDLKKKKNYKQSFYEIKCLFANLNTAMEIIKKELAATQYFMDKSITARREEIERLSLNVHFISGHLGIPLTYPDEGSEYNTGNDMNQALQRELDRLKVINANSTKLALQTWKILNFVPQAGVSPEEAMLRNFFQRKMYATEVSTTSEVEPGNSKSANQHAPPLTLSPPHSTVILTNHRLKTADLLSSRPPVLECWVPLNQQQLVQGNEDNVEEDDDDDDDYDSDRLIIDETNTSCRDDTQGNVGSPSTLPGTREILFEEQAADNKRSNIPKQTNENLQDTRLAKKRKYLSEVTPNQDKEKERNSNTSFHVHGMVDDGRQPSCSSSSLDLDRQTQEMDEAVEQIVTNSFFHCTCGRVFRGDEYKNHKDNEDCNENDPQDKVTCPLCKECVSKLNINNHLVEIHEIHFTLNPSSVQSEN